MITQVHRQEGRVLLLLLVAKTAGPEKWQAITSDADVVWRQAKLHR